MKLDEAEIDRRENFCLRLIHGAAPIVLEGYRIQQGRPVSLKGPQDYLTVTDRLVEDHIREAIEREFRGRWINIRHCEIARSNMRAALSNCTPISSSSIITMMLRW